MCSKLFGFQRDTARHDCARRRNCTNPLSPFPSLSLPLPSPLLPSPPSLPLGGWKPFPVPLQVERRECEDDELELYSQRAKLIRERDSNWTLGWTTPNCSCTRKLDGPVAPAAGSNAQYLGQYLRQGFGWVPRTEAAHSMCTRLDVVSFRGG